MTSTVSSSSSSSVLVSLPIAKSTTLDWELPGHGLAYEDCGSIRYRGCLHVEDHPKALDREQEGRAFVRAYRRSCNRKECPKCYEGWASLEADRMTYRLEQYHGKWRKPIHVSVNPGPELWGVPYVKLRSQAYRILKRVGLVGGSLIYHPFRQNEDKSWFFSPHFHMIGYGFHRGDYIKGWVVRNHGVRRSVFATALYQLSHAGVSARYDTITWWGKLSYNKLKVPKMVEERPKCPLCGAELVPLLYVGNVRVPPPSKDGDYFLDSEEWMEKPLRWGF